MPSEQIARPARHNRRSRSVDLHFRMAAAPPACLHDQSSSARSPTTTLAPFARSASAWPTRSTPKTTPKRPARPACTPASASSNTPACAGSRPRARAPARKVSGAGLPARCSRSASDAVDYDFEELGDAGRNQDVTSVGAGGDDGAPQPGAECGPEVADRALVGLHAVLADQLEEQLVLAVAQPVDGFPVRRIAGAPCGSTIALEARNERTPSYVGLPSTYWL